MNHSDLAEKVRSLAIPVAILVLVAAILVTSRLNSPSRYFSGDTFAGCYSDGFSNQIRLSKEKEILADGRPVGHYRIVSPVGGKHGYLVETTDIKVLKLPDGRITIQSGSGGLLWPISENGNLQMLFAPDGNVSMHRDKKLLAVTSPSPQNKNCAPGISPAKLAASAIGDRNPFWSSRASRGVAMAATALSIVNNSSDIGMIANMPRRDAITTRPLGSAASQGGDSRNVAQSFALEKIHRNGDPTPWEYRLKDQGTVIASCYALSDHGEAGLCTSLGYYSDLVYSVGLRDSDV